MHFFLNEQTHFTSHRILAGEKRERKNQSTKGKQRGGKRIARIVQTEVCITRVVRKDWKELKKLKRVVKKNWGIALRRRHKSGKIISLPFKIKTIYIILSHRSLESGNVRSILQAKFKHLGQLQSCNSNNNPMNNVWISTNQENLTKLQNILPALNAVRRDLVSQEYKLPLVGKISRTNLHIFSTLSLTLKFSNKGNEHHLAGLIRFERKCPDT